MNPDTMMLLHGFMRGFSVVALAFAIIEHFLDKEWHFSAFLFIASSFTAEGLAP